jgi:type IV pilus assembly protein PilC
MRKYSYKARDSKGRIVAGDVEAADDLSAAKLLRSKGFIITNLAPARENIMASIARMRGGISLTDLSGFTRQLATMINAGLPITEALSILRMQANQNLTPVITQVLADVEGGESLSKAMARHPKAFSTTYISLIKSGETGGVLDKVLARLADNLEKEREFRGKVKTAMVYPAIIVIGMVIVALIMVIFVIPRLISLYDQFNAELPLTTKILAAVTGLFTNFWPLLLVLAIIGWYSYSKFKETPYGKRKIDEFIFKIPLVGDLQRQIILTELTRTLSLMVGSGVPILDAISVTTAATKNTVISDALRDIGRRVEKGFPISLSFAKHPEAFPYIVVQMVAVGEETGKMDEVLDKISRVFEIESDQKVKALTTAIEPLIMIVLGIGVAFLVISIILPIYNLTQSI